ncbi:MAG: aminotransferase class IV [Clostridia bacterium]|nr:aminotransferase class IV [Clostridia bacterium]
MKTLGYYNGRYAEIEDMSIPMTDRACWFGDGVYDAGLSLKYHMVFLDEHIDRFFRSADLMEIRIPVSKKELHDLMYSLIHRLDTGDLMYYIQVTRGSGIRNHVFPNSPANLWVTFKPAELVDGSVPEKMITLEDTRFFHCNIKTLNLIPSVIASQRAREAGCGEAVLYRPGGRVTEGSHSNIHILKSGELRTAPTDNLILPGIARAHLIKACRTLNIPVREEPFTLDDLFSADEVLMTMSSHPCCRADTIDGKPVGMKDDRTFRLLREHLIREYLSDGQI